MRTNALARHDPGAEQRLTDTRPPDHDILILGAGAAGLFCALTAARRGRKATLVDQCAEAGRKLRAAGGGCVCTNMRAAPERYRSQDPAFAGPALAGYSPSDFLVILHALGLSSKDAGEGRALCSEGATALAEALEKGCREAGCEFLLGRSVTAVTPPAAENGAFRVELGAPGPTVPLTARRLVIALGSPAWPALGGSDNVARLAQKLGLPYIPTRPALCPLVLSGEEAALCREISGARLDATVSCGGANFGGGVEFTARGLSGPAARNASLIWRRGEPLNIDCAPGVDAAGRLHAPENAERHAADVLAEFLPHPLAEAFLAGLPKGLGPASGRAAGELTEQQIASLAAAIHSWRVTPQATAGMALAEAASGGLDTTAFSPKTMRCRILPGLYAIGEALDVTGETGGFNLQWAWASAFAAGSAL